MNFSSQTEEDFSKAHNKALFNEIQHFLSPEEASLIAFNDVKQLIKPINETYVGMKVIPIDKIIGSEGRYKDFDNHFFPKSNFLKTRWEKIDSAHINSIELPPIKVYEISGLYFVRDGNHRVSVAKSKGIEFIDAEVVSLQSEIKLKKPDNMKDIIRQIVNYEKMVFYSETFFGDITDYWCLDFTTPGRYDVILNHILTHKYYMNQQKNEEISMEEAVNSWFNKVYLPIVTTVRTKKILRKFPRRTLGDMYVWIVRYWDELKQKFGEDVNIEYAVEDFEKTHKIPLQKRIINQIKRIILRKAMYNNISDTIEDVKDIE
ncbi:MAG: transcriptional regulator [Treponema sp.]|nr:transcriptional regulator [Treponema sp.]